MKKVFSLCLFIFSFTHCAHKYQEGEPASFKKMAPNTINDSLDYAGLIAAIDVTVKQLKKTPLKKYEIAETSITYQDYAEALLELRANLDLPMAPKEKQKYIQDNFYFYALNAEQGWGKAFITGYYAPQVRGSYKRSKKYSEPLLGVPDDMLKIDLKLFAQALPSIGKMGLTDQIRDGQLRGRLIEKNKKPQIVPYYSRREILEKNLKAKVLCYVDPVDAFFMQIQGSGEVILPSGNTLQINYADQNGHSYYPIGKALLNMIPREQMSMQKIEDYLRSQSVKERNRIMNLNPSYVFFQKSETKSVTAFGVEAQAGRSIATDAKFLPHGLLSYLVYPDPDDLNKNKSQFVINHDAGGAIRGPNRVDLFWGHGDLAEALSGGLKGAGELYFLLPKLNKKGRE